MFAPVVGVTVNPTVTPVVVAGVDAMNDARLRALTVTVAEPLTAGKTPSVAVTFAVAVVVSTALALPLASLVTVVGEIDPLSVDKATGTPPIPLPPSSTTVTTTCAVPPDAPNACGVVVTFTSFAAAVPTFNWLFVWDAPPEYAVMTAVPLVVPVRSLTVTWPLCVRASEGSIVPIVVVKVMTVPFCTGVPTPGRAATAPPLPPTAWPFSMTVATTETSLFSEAFVVERIRLMTLPVGARSGTLSQAATRAKTAATESNRVRRCVTIYDANDNSLMSLRGQAGYAMAALLVALAVMAVLMSVALPVWRQQAQREKEEELVFRGNQYVRAIRLFQSKSQTFPTSVDMLVQGHFLRKKYKDPITNEDFDYIPAAGMAGQPGQQGGPGAVGGAGGGRGPITAGGQGGGRGPTPSSGVSSPTSMGSQPGGAAAGGMIPGGMLGVRSKSKDESIRLYLGRNHYNEWMFTYVGQQPGGAGGRGQPGGGTGGRGGRGPIQPGDPTRSGLPFPPGGGGGGGGGGTGGGGRGSGPGTPGRGGSPFPFPPGGPGRGGGRQ